MTSGYQEPQLALERDTFAQNYNRTPFGFSHNLHRLELFGDDALRALCRAYAGHPQDYFVSRNAASPGTVFYDVPPSDLTPHEAFDRLEPGSFKILLKRLERHDPRFDALLRTLFDQVREELGQNGFCDEAMRLESSIFITAPQSTTPFHFDPEVNFFSQIEGDKIYHLYSPSDLGEQEVEPLYVRATVDIGQVDLNRRDRSAEHVFALRPGSGLHQPQDSPHWVETGDSRSVSYTFVYETRDARNLARVRSFNHYLRSLRIEPMRPGLRPSRDAMKAAVMNAALPVRKQLGKTVRKAFGR
jgi:hypothetical protein